MAHLALFLFGPPRIELNGNPVKVSRHKALALLTYLTITAEIHSRNTLATLFWPDHDQSRARAALRRVLVTLNRNNLGDFLEINRETIGLKSKASVWVDVIHFHHLLVTCLSTQQDADTICLSLLTEAVTLYNADFMTGFSLRDSPDFDEWQLFQAETLKHDLTSALARLIRCHSNINQFETAISYAQRWLKIDPYYELAHRQLMQLYSWNNQRSAAIHQYQECVRILKEDLDVPPSTETTELYQRIQSSQESKLERQDTPKITISTPIATPFYNFPVQPTPFIGRQSTLKELVKRLKNPDCRLLTLTGPGGIGKTRLAIQVAMSQSNNFNNGLYFIPLTTVNSAYFLTNTVAESLQFSLEGQADPYLQLINYLKRKQMLLVMDNFEHLTNEVDLLLDILKYAPNIKIIVTSRERLNLQNEWIFEVKGMHYPAHNQTDQLETYSAINLFLHRAYRVDSSFTLTQVEKPHMVRICQLVQGIPLAIELAATWVRVLSCKEIAQEIEHIYITPNNLDFLATSLQDVPKRHQSLRLVFEHSWNLLSNDEQQVFKQLSVFRGGCSREAIEAITGASLFLVSALVDKSLLTRSTPNRYEMHEVLRQYAVEKLQQNPEDVEIIKNRHCNYYAFFLQSYKKQLRGPQQKEILEKITKEIENIRVSWGWAIMQIDLDSIQKVREVLWYFYAMYGWFKEGAEIFEEAISGLAVPDSKKQNTLPVKQQTVIGQLLANQGWFYLRQGLYKEATAVLQQSIAIFEHLNDWKNIAAPWHYLGILDGELGEPTEAKRLIQKSLAIYRNTDNQWGVAWCLSTLAYHISQINDVNQEKAIQLLEESLIIYKAIGNKQGIAVALNTLGYITYRQGNFLSARELFRENLVLCREVSYPRGIAVALNNLGHVTSDMEDYEVSKSYYYEALKIATNIQAIPLALAALGGLAVPYSHQGRQEQALEFLFVVIHHPAGNKETQNRAITCLSNLKINTPPEIFITIQTQVKDNPRSLEFIIADILANLS